MSFCWITWWIDLLALHAGFFVALSQSLGASCPAIRPHSPSGKIRDAACRSLSLCFILFVFLLGLYLALAFSFSVYHYRGWIDVRFFCFHYHAVSFPLVCVCVWLWIGRYSSDLVSSLPLCLSLSRSFPVFSIPSLVGALLFAFVMAIVHLFFTCCIFSVWWLLLLLLHIYSLQYSVFWRYLLVSVNIDQRLQFILKCFVRSFGSRIGQGSGCVYHRAWAEALEHGCHYSISTLVWLLRPLLVTTQAVVLMFHWDIYCIARYVERFWMEDCRLGVMFKESHTSMFVWELFKNKFHVYRSSGNHPCSVGRPKPFFITDWLLKW